MSYASISITSLEKSGKIFAKQLESSGYTVEFDSFRCGPSGSAIYGPSYVELCVYKDDGPMEEICSVKFYGDGYGGHPICGIFGGDKWSEMKSQAIEFINKRL
jgi:hypothetical protein